MIDSTREFYDQLAGDYHLIFEDWQSSIGRQAEIIDRIIQSHLRKPRPQLSVLDCSCGIGTQALGLAGLGYRVTGSDISPRAIDRARKEATRQNVAVKFHVADFRKLEPRIKGSFDVVISFDNALPHLLTDDDLTLALRNIGTKLKQNGLFLASIRDYDQILREKPRTTLPYFYESKEGKRVLIQVWEWNDRIYTMHHFVIQERDGKWKTRHRLAEYRALLRSELDSILTATDFSEIKWLMPERTGFYQPIVSARKNYISK